MIKERLHKLIDAIFDGNERFNMKYIFITILLILGISVFESKGQEAQSNSSVANSYLDAESLIPMDLSLKMTPRGYRWLLNKRRVSISPIPDKYVGWWMYIDHNIGRFTTRHSKQHIMEITKEGKITVYLQSDLWTNELVPACLWINNAPDFVMSGDVRIHQNQLFIASDMAYGWWERRGRLDRIDNAFAVFDIDLSSSKRLHIRPILDVTSQGDSFQWTRRKKGYYMSRFKKIDTPYTTFPNVKIGCFPDEATRNAPGFWDNVRYALLLDVNEISENNKAVLDSLGVEIKKYNISTDTKIDVAILLTVLEQIHNAEEEGNKVLVLCSSEYNRMSLLIGACYHFQKTGKPIESGWSNKNVISSVCESGKLPPWDEFSNLLKSSYESHCDIL